MILKNMFVSKGLPFCLEENYINNHWSIEKSLKILIFFTLVLDVICWRDWGNGWQRFTFLKKTPTEPI